MVSKSFDIQPADLLPFDPASKKLLVEISRDLVNVILVDKEMNTPIAVEMFSCKNFSRGDWQDLLKSSGLLGFKNVEAKVIIANSEMVPIPAALYHPDLAKQQLELFYAPQSNQYIGGDVLDQPEMVVAWSLPADIYAVLKNHFYVLQVVHVGSLIIQQQPGAAATGHIVVYNSLGWVALWMDSSLKIIKAVNFTKPDDFSWHLLNICKQFGLDPEAVQWRISGSVEEVSPLWQAITRFLDPIAPYNSRVAMPDTVPAHYFSHLF